METSKTSTSPKILEGTYVTMKDDDKGVASLDALKKKMLTEKTVSEPVSGLMFFPLAKRETEKSDPQLQNPAE